MKGYGLVWMAYLKLGQMVIASDRHKNCQRGSAPGVRTPHFGGSSTAELVHSSFQAQKEKKYRHVFCFLTSFSLPCLQFIHNHSNTKFSLPQLLHCVSTAILATDFFLTKTLDTTGIRSQHGSYRFFLKLASQENDKDKQCNSHTDLIHYSLP